MYLHSRYNITDMKNTENASNLSCGTLHFDTLQSMTVLTSVISKFYEIMTAKSELTSRDQICTNQLLLSVLYY